MTKITYAGGAGAGEATQMSVQAFASSYDVMTSMQNGSGNLELISWHVDSSTYKVTRAATATAGTANDVALVLVGRRAVTAVRSGSNNLLLISWNVPNDLKSIDRLHDSGSMAGEASQIAMTTVNNAMLVTAMRAGNGDLLLITWALNADGSFTRLGDSTGQAGAVSLVTIAPTLGGVVTAVRNGSGNLELIAWKVSADGKTIKRENPSGANAGSVGEIALLGHADTNTLITAVQNGGGNLLLIAWRVLNGGLAIERLGDTSTLLPASDRPGTASHIGICADGPSSYVASMRRGSGDLELIAFTLTNAGGWIRTGDLVQGSGTDVTETHVTNYYGGVLGVYRNRDFLNLAIWNVSQVSSSATAEVVAAAVPRAAPNTAAFNDFFKSALADPQKKTQLKGDWVKLVSSELAVSADQKEHLAGIPAADAQALHEAIGKVVEQGGSIHIERENERSPGTLVVQPAAAAQVSAASAAGGVTPALSIGIFHCTFDANCRNWHCGWGPAKK